MRLPNRSPGYLLDEQTEKMVWPNLDLVPHFDGVPRGEYGEDICSGLEAALATPARQNVMVELKKLKKSLGSGGTHLGSFFNRFPVEYDREQESMRRGKEKKPLDQLSEDGKKLALNGFFVKHLTEERVKQINDQLGADIHRLLNKEPVRSFRAYDRSEFYTSGPNVKLIDDTLRESGSIQAAEEYFGFSMRVFSVTLHISFPDDVHFNQVFSDKKYTPKTCGLHYDPKSGTIKSILYLKNITEDDGPFTYLPKTHNFINPPLERLSAKANCTTNYLDSPEARASFMKLPEKMRKTSIFGTLTDDSDELSNKILEREKPFLSEDGDVIVFDPGMQHRGGMCKSGRRISLQIAIRG